MSLTHKAYPTRPAWATPNQNPRVNQRAIQSGTITTSDAPIAHNQAVLSHLGIGREG